MKTNFKIVASLATLLLVAAAGVIIFEACNKKHEMVKNIPELNATGLSDMDKEMLLFGEKMKSAQKGGETMPLEEAVRNLTNYQNFRLCDASKHSSDMERFTIETEIPVNDGNVYLSDIYSIYESNKKQIREKLASLEGEDKTIYCIFSKVEEESKDGESAKIVTSAIMSRNGDEPPANYFNDTVCWVVNSQFCTDCTGGNAVQVLDSRLKTIMIGNYGCPVGYRVYFYDSDDYGIFASEYIDPNSPNGHYGLIHGDYDTFCLSADDMRYYLNSAINKINEWGDGQNESGKVIEFVWYFQFNDSYLIAIFSRVGCTYVGFDD